MPWGPSSRPFSAFENDSPRNCKGLRLCALLSARKSKEERERKKMMKKPSFHGSAGPLSKGKRARGRKDWGRKKRTHGSAGPRVRGSAEQGKEREGKEASGKTKGERRKGRNKGDKQGSTGPRAHGTTAPVGQNET